MPELPEVETIRLSLQRYLIGKVIKHIDVREKKQFIGDQRKLIGKKITALTRKGKVLSIKIGDSFLNIHLKLTGQLLFSAHSDHAVFPREIPRANSKTLPAKTTHIILYFDDGSALFFNDLRKFGWMRLLNRPDETSAVDLLSQDFTLDLFKNSLMKSRKPIKNLLLEQDKFAGIGNIYANDALWQARIHPLKSASTLSDVEVGELFKAIRLIIGEALKRHGSSDEFYVTPENKPGDYQNHFKVYHREGLPCPRCGTKIKRIKHSGRSSFFCPRCQKLPHS